MPVLATHLPVKRPLFCADFSHPVAGSTSKPRASCKPFCKILFPRFQERNLGASAREFRSIIAVNLAAKHLEIPARHLAPNKHIPPSTWLITITLAFGKFSGHQISRFDSDSVVILREKFPRQTQRLLKIKLEIQRLAKIEIGHIERR